MCLNKVDHHQFPFSVSVSAIEFQRFIPTHCYENNYTRFQNYATFQKNSLHSNVGPMWVSVKNGNRNDRNRKSMPNFSHKFQFLPILCGKLNGHFRFRSFRFQIRSFLFPFFAETRFMSYSLLKIANVNNRGFEHYFI